MKTRYLIIAWILILSALNAPWLREPAAASSVESMHIFSNPFPTPTVDPLAIPVLSDNPTQLELGKNLYYYHCMPCHGDVGQGLTDAWRMVWEEDHRNCWGRGCHAGRPKDEGFYIPTVIPAIMAQTDALKSFANTEILMIYLRQTHPPQEPGRLKDSEYRALTEYLWVSNNKPLLAVEISTPSAQPSAALTDTPLKPTPTSPLLAEATTTPLPVSQMQAPPPKNPTEFKMDIQFISLAVAALLILLILIILVSKRFHREDRL